MTLTVGQTHTGTVAAFGTSFYRFTTTGDGVYTISLTNTASDLSWELYEYDGTYIGECDISDFRADEICITDALPPGDAQFLLCLHFHQPLQGVLPEFLQVDSTEAIRFHLEQRSR